MPAATVVTGYGIRESSVITSLETAHLVPRPHVGVTDMRLPFVQPRDALGLDLREDQIVQLTVEVRDAELRLMLRDRAVDHPPGFPMALGDRFKASVHLQENGAAVLRPVSGARQESLVAGVGPLASFPPSALARLMWRPAGMEALMALLRPEQLVRVCAELGTTGDAKAGELDQWLRTRPRMGSLTGSALRRALLSSGCFTEARVARGDPMLRDDAKVVIRDLLALLGDSDGDVGRGVAEALDDVEAAQVRAVENHQNGIAMFQAVLAFADALPVRIELRRQKSGAPDESDVWCVDLHSDVEGIGAVWLAARIHARLSVDVTLWAAEADTCMHASSRQSALAEQFSQWGLHLSGFQVIHGQPAPARSAHDAGDAGHVVDIKA